MIPQKSNNRFIFVALVITIITGGLWFYSLLNLPPSTLVNYAFFLASFFFALALVLTMIFYKLAYHAASIHHSYINSNRVIENCFRRAGLISGVVTAIAALKIFNLLNAGLLVVLIIGAFFTEVLFMRKH